MAKQISLDALQSTEQKIKTYIDNKANALVIKTATTLFEATSSTSLETITLSQPVTDFDAIEIVVRDMSVGTSAASSYEIDSIVLGTTNLGAYYGQSNYSWYTIGSDGVTMTRVVNSTNTRPYKVYGIKYSFPENYSENEQIVGTWIDGKPLYQRVLVVPATNFPLKTNAWTKIAFNDPTLNNISIKTGIFLNVNGQIDVSVLPSNDGGISYYSSAAYGSQGNGEIIIKYVKL